MMMGFGRGWLFTAEWEVKSDFIFDTHNSVHGRGGLFLHVRFNDTLEAPLFFPYLLWSLSALNFYYY